MQNSNTHNIIIESSLMVTSLDVNPDLSYADRIAKVRNFTKLVKNYCCHLV